MRLITAATKDRPEPWHAVKEAAPRRWLRPFLALEWCFDWIAYYLSHWKFLEVLDYMSSLSVLIAVIFYFSESGDRIKQKHYQAWQVINTAQGKGGSGGRLEALQELNLDHVPLVGVDVSGAYLQDVMLKKASLVRANFSGADVRNSNFRLTDLTDADLNTANFRGANLSRALLVRADLTNADLTGADLSGVDLSGASLANATMRDCDLKDARWRNIARIDGAEIGGMQNAPEGFIAWARAHGATQTAESSK
jgi:hypothetical protein